MGSAIAELNVWRNVASYRALLTEREREVLAGRADVSPNYRYVIRSRVRGKIDRLAEDLELLEEYQPDLFESVLDLVAAFQSG